MISGIKEPLCDVWREWRQFLREYRNLLWICLAFVFFVYGLRIFRDHIFIDSELMILRPEFMQGVWLGSGRFGLVLTSRLFGMGRLVPYLQGGGTAFTMYWAGIISSYCVYNWSGRNREYRFFHYLFPLLFVSAPVWTEQFLFLLQAFEIAFAVLLCLAAAFCTSRWVQKSEPVFLVLGVIFMVWGFGSYQAMFPLYLSLSLTAFVLSYINGRTEDALRCGIKHALAFFAGCLLYMILVKATKYAAGADSGYISGMVRWRADGIRNCLFHIRLELVRVLKGKSLYFGKLYLPAMCLCGLQMMRRGWKHRKSIRDYLCFLFGLALLALSPFFLNLATGNLQMIRAHLAYPAVSALFLAHLTVRERGRSGAKRWKALGIVLAQAACIAAAERNGVRTIQLYESAWEAYRNDLITANLMYADICETAGSADVSECMVIFVGKRDAGLAGQAAAEELSGRSFFEVEAHTELGGSGRIGSWLLTLGMDMRVMGAEEGDRYLEAIAYMEGAPDWPAEGSVRKMGDDVIVVKMSEP